MTSKSLYALVKLIKCLAIIILIIMVAVLIYQYSNISQKNAEKNLLKAEYDGNSQLIDEYNEILDNYQDSDYYNKYIDEHARKNLGMVKGDEIVIVAKK